MAAFRCLLELRPVAAIAIVALLGASGLAAAPAGQAKTSLVGRVNAALAATWQVIEGPVITDPIGACGVGVRRITIQGKPDSSGFKRYLDIDGAPPNQGMLADHQQIVVVPLETCTSYHIGAALIYVAVGRNLKYVGFLWSTDARAGVSIKNGRIRWTTPVGNAGGTFRGGCCPPRVRVQEFTVIGDHLRKVSEHIMTPPR